jgi:hypothetical protein
MQLNFNSISKVDYSSLKSHVHCDILFIVNVCWLDEYIIEHLKQNIALFISSE